MEQEKDQAQVQVEQNSQINVDFNPKQSNSKSFGMQEEELNEQTQDYFGLNQQEVDLNTLQIQIQQLKSGEGSEGMILELESRLQQGCVIEEKLNEIVSRIQSAVSKEDIQTIKELISEAQTQRVNVPSIQRYQQLVNEYKWVQRIYQTLLNTVEQEEEISNENEQLYELLNKIDEYINLVELQLNNLTEEQQQTFSQDIYTLTISNNRIQEIAQKICVNVWRKSVEGVFVNQIYFNQLQTIYTSVPDIAKGCDIYNQINILYTSGITWSQTTQEILGGDLLNQIKELIRKVYSSEGDEQQYIKEQAIQQLEELENRLSDVLSIYNRYLSGIQDFKEQYQQIQRGYDQIIWCRESAQFIQNLKNGKLSVKKDSISERLRYAEEIGITQEWKCYQELGSMLENIEELQIQILISPFAQKITLSKAKALYDKVTQSQWQYNSFLEIEGISGYQTIIETNLQKCQGWLEQVQEFFNVNSIVQLEQQDIIKQGIHSLRENAKELAYSVVEGEQLLDNILWQLQARAAVLDSVETQYTLDQCIELLNYTDSCNVTCDTEVVTKLREIVSSGQNLRDTVNSIKKKENELNENILQSEQASDMTLDDLKQLGDQLNSSRVKLPVEVDYIQNLIESAQQQVELLDQILKQEQKPNFVEVSGIYNKLRKFPLNLRNSENTSVFEKVEICQRLLSTLETTKEINTETAANLLVEYSQCNVYIPEYHQLQVDYDDSKTQLQAMRLRLQTYNSDTPLSYEEVLELQKQLGNIVFDIEGELSTLQEVLYVIRVQSIKEANQVLLSELNDNVDTNVIKNEIQVSYQAPQKVIQLSVQGLKELLIYGYQLQNRNSNEGIVLVETIRFLEQISIRIEQFVQDIISVRDTSKLEEIDPVCFGFIDCSSYVQQQRNSLKGVGYPLIPEQLVIRDQVQVKQLGELIQNYKLKLRGINSAQKRSRDKNGNSQQLKKRDRREREDGLIDYYPSGEDEENELIKKQKMENKEKLRRKLENEQNKKEKIRNELKKQINPNDPNGIIKVSDILQYDPTQSQQQQQQQFNKENNKNMEQIMKKPKLTQGDIIQQKKDFWQTSGNSVIQEILRHENVERLRKFLQKCKYLRLDKISSLQVAKKLEESCYQENPKNVRNYDKFVIAVLQALKNISKMKYINMRFIQENFNMDYIYQFKDLEIETLIKENDKAKEILIQRRLTTAPELSQLIQKRTSPKTDQQFASDRSRSISVENVQPLSRMKRKENNKKLEVITPEKDPKKKLKSHSDMDAQVLARNFVQNNGITQVQPPPHQKVYNIFEGTMKFSQRSSTKIMLLTSCNQSNIVKLPRLSYNDKQPLTPESTMTQESFDQYLEGLLKLTSNDRIDIIVSGWIQTSLELYRNLCSQLANDLLNQGLIGLTPYTKYSTIYFLHKAQIKAEWQNTLNSITQRHDPEYDSQLCYFIVSRDYRQQETYQFIKAEKYNGVFTRKNTEQSTYSYQDVIPHETYQSSKDFYNYNELSPSKQGINNNSNSNNILKNQDYNIQRASKSQNQSNTINNNNNDKSRSDEYVYSYINADKPVKTKIDTNVILKPKKNYQQNNKPQQQQQQQQQQQYSNNKQTNNKISYNNNNNNNSNLNQLISKGQQNGYNKQIQQDNQLQGNMQNHINLQNIDPVNNNTLPQNGVAQNNNMQRPYGPEDGYPLTGRDPYYQEYYGRPYYPQDPYYRHPSYDYLLPRYYAPPPPVYRRPLPLYPRYPPGYYDVDYPQPEYEREMLYGRYPRPRYPGYRSNRTYRGDRYELTEEDFLLNNREQDQLYQQPFVTQNELIKEH